MNNEVLRFRKEFRLTPSGDEFYLNRDEIVKALRLCHKYCQTKLTGDKFKCVRDNACPLDYHDDDESLGPMGITLFYNQLSDVFLVVLLAVQIAFKEGHDFSLGYDGFGLSAKSSYTWESLGIETRECEQCKLIAEYLNIYCDAEYGTSPRYAWYYNQQLPKLANAIARIVMCDPDVMNNDPDDYLW